MSSCYIGKEFQNDKKGGSAVDDRKKQKKKSSSLYGCIPYVFPQNRYEGWNNMQKCFMF